jgi:chorismate-pyruvate lyase
MTLAITYVEAETIHDLLKIAEEKLNILANANEPDSVELGEIMRSLNEVTRRVERYIDNGRTVRQ